MTIFSTYFYKFNVIVMKMPGVFLELFETAGTHSAVFPPTEIYNEGWMIRVLLSAASKGIDCFPFTFFPDAKWYSEAQIGSPFLPRFRRDPLAENLTHLDAVIGHYEFRPGTKTGLALTANSEQFIVIEAKMYSLLSKGIKNAPNYDQAARIVACMAWTIEQSSRVVPDFKSLGFFVLAPEEQINNGKFSRQMNKRNIIEKVKHRIESYSDEIKKSAELRNWYENSFLPTVECIDLQCVSGEWIIDNIMSVDNLNGPIIRNFYNQCLKFNART